MCSSMQWNISIWKLHSPAGCSQPGISYPIIVELLDLFNELLMNIFIHLLTHPFFWVGLFCALSCCTTVNNVFLCWDDMVRIAICIWTKPHYPALQSLWPCGILSWRLSDRGDELHWSFPVWWKLCPVGGNRRTSRCCPLNRYRVKSHQIISGICVRLEMTKANIWYKWNLQGLNNTKVVLNLSY